MPPGSQGSAGRKGGRQHAKEALAVIVEQPGIKAPELAARMTISQTYLYRVLPDLEAEGKIEKKGRGWHPSEIAPADA
jgi:DNA-binding IscR family transcriptional regulator